LKLEGAVQFPMEVSLHSGGFFFLHAWEMSPATTLCFAPITGGAADCPLDQPAGRIASYRFDGDDLRLGVADVKHGIAPTLPPDAEPKATVKVLTLPLGIHSGTFTTSAIADLALDATNVYWCAGKEIHARTKDSIARDP